MKVDIVSSIVTEPEAIDFLCDPARHRYLEPFFHDQSVARAARELREPLHVVYRKVKRMTRLGLIRETRLEGRDGRPIRLYRVVCERFFVPFTHKSLEEILTAFNQYRNSQLMTSIAASWLGFSDTNHGWGSSIFRTASGKIGVQAPTTSVSVLSPTPSKPTLLRWRELQLDPDEANALQAQLLEVIGRFADTPGTGQQTYLVGVSMAALAG